MYIVVLVVVSYIYTVLSSEVNVTSLLFSKKIIVLT